MKNIFLIYFVFLIHATFAQQEVLNLDIVSSKYKGLRGAVLNDSAFVVISQTTGAKCYWLNGASAREVVLPELNNVPVFAVGGIDTTYYYFIKETKKQVSFSALAVKGESRVLSNQNIVLETRLYGSYVENGHLFLLAVDKAGYGMLLLEYDGLKQISSQRFSLSFNLGKFNKTGVSFYHANIPVMASNVDKYIKIMKDKDCIWISIDEPRPQNSEIQQAVNRTIVTKLDLKTGTSTNRLFPEGSDSDFSSLIYKGHLYRMVQENGYHLDIYNLESGRKIGVYSKTVSKNDGQMVNWIVRDGAKLSVQKIAWDRFIIRPAHKPLIIVDSLDNGAILASIGDHNEIYNRVPNVFPLGLAGVLVPLIATVAIREIGEGPEFHEYVQFQIKDNKQELFNEIATRRQRIDEFETLQKVSFKGYMHTPASAYGFYMNLKSTQLKIVRFE